MNKKLIVSIGLLVNFLINNLWAQSLICDLESAVINLRDFYKETKDDTGIFLKAFECAEKILNKSGRVIIKIPAGTYYLSSPILIKQPTKSDWKAIKIEGDGVEQSVVLLEKGGFNIDCLLPEGKSEGVIGQS